MCNPTLAFTAAVANIPLAIQDGERRAPGREQELACAAAASDRGASAGEVQVGRTGGSSSSALAASDRIESRTLPGFASLAGVPSGGSPRPTETPVLAPADDRRSRSRERSPQYAGQVSDRRKGHSCTNRCKQRLKGLPNQPLCLNISCG